MQHYEKHIPNVLTLANMLLGLLAIVYIFYDHLIVTIIASEGLFSTERLYLGKMHIGALLVFLAVIFDFADGAMARLLDAQSELGKQLDSLADLITFGVVPGIIGYYMISISMIGHAAAIQMPVLIALPGFLLTLCAAIRLGKFNIDNQQTHGFRGLPTPAAAMVIASLPLILFFDELGLRNVLLEPWVMYGIVILVSFLMVSNIPLIGFKYRKGDPLNRHRFFFLIFVVIVLAGGYFLLNTFFLPVPVLIFLYIIFSMIFNKTQKRDELHSTH